MTSKERLLAVIRGETTDRVPATVHQWQSYHYTRIMGVSNELSAFRKTKLDAIIYPWQYMVSYDHSDIKKIIVTNDMGNGVYEQEINIETPLGNLHGKNMVQPYTRSETEYLFKTKDDLKIIEKYMRVPVINSDGARKLHKELGEDGILRFCTNGPQGSPWQDACALFGTENMIFYAYDEPDWTHNLLEVLLQKKIEFYKESLAPVSDIVSMIETGGGAGSNNVISPAMFEEFCLPYDCRQHDIIHDIAPNIAISYHTCGGMMQLLDLIPQNGCDFSETLSSPDCGGDIINYQDELKVKSVLGSKVKLIGGINQTNILEKGTRENIFKEVERCFKYYGQGGNYIMMASDHFFEASIENIINYSQAVEEICYY